MEIYSVPLGLIVIFALRLLVPLTILRWPLWGGLASAIVDALDTNIVKLFGVEIPNYVTTDKYLDLYYFSLELVVSLSWTNKLARNTSLFLYIWRLIGVISLQLTHLRYLLFVFPNLFEHFFIFYLIIIKMGKETPQKKWLNSTSKLFLVLFLLWLTKIPQELVLHVWQVGSPIEEGWAYLQRLLGQ